MSQAAVAEQEVNNGLSLPRAPPRVYFMLNPTVMTPALGALQLIRGTATLPHGTGRDARVAVFTSNPGDAEAAAAAGAAIVGGEELVAQVAQDKGIAADTVVATPDMVPRLGKIARILGPKCAAAC